MNYYEELAVAQDASLEEIRHAYKSLARVLHPDNQSELRLKSAAERQMVRLNDILATLTDPEKRREYDGRLCQKPAIPIRVPPPPAVRPPPPQIGAGGLQRHGPWVLAGAILVGVGLWFLVSNESGVPGAERVAAPAQQEPAQASRRVLGERPAPVKQPRAAGMQQAPRSLPPAKLALEPQVANQPDSPAATDSAIRAAQTAGSGTVAAVENHRTEIDTVAAAAVLPPAASPPAGEVAPTFAGRWFFVPHAKDAPADGMYPPEFIELFLSEERGELGGRYWARYQIRDKALSPEVQLRISGGISAGNTSTLRWVSDDGAKGQLRLVLVNGNSMQASWWTSEFGSRAALTSGTAVLVRQQLR